VAAEAAVREWAAAVVVPGRRCAGHQVVSAPLKVAGDVAARAQAGRFVAAMMVLRACSAVIDLDAPSTVDRGRQSLA
jgi:hypothetical protein